VPELDAPQVEMDRFTDTVRLADPAEMLEMVPVLKTGARSVVAGLVDTGGRKLGADALLPANARALRRAGGTVVFDAEVLGIRRAADRWIVDTVGDAFFTKIVVNAAGTWAD
jgi:D-arginine dehydrogenase